MPRFRLSRAAAIIALRRCCCTRSAACWLLKVLSPSQVILAKADVRVGAVLHSLASALAGVVVLTLARPRLLAKARLVHGLGGQVQPGDAARSAFGVPPPAVAPSARGSRPSALVSTLAVLALVVLARPRRPARAGTVVSKFGVAAWRVLRKWRCSTSPRSRHTRARHPVVCACRHPRLHALARACDLARARWEAPYSGHIVAYSGAYSDYMRWYMPGL